VDEHREKIGSGLGTIWRSLAGAMLLDLAF
jgi:hypothetical protein